MSGERNKIVQIVQNFYPKCAQIVVQARVANFPYNSGSKPNIWFNLVTYGVDALKDELRLWKSATGLDSPPLVLETFVSSRNASPQQVLVLLKDGKAYPVEKQEAILERWTIQFSARGKKELEPQVIYKHIIVLMRALYAYTRLMPAWQLKQDIEHSRLQNQKLSIGCRVINGADMPITVRNRVPLERAIGEVAGERNKKSQHITDSHSFHPIEMPEGSLTVSVEYRVDSAFALQDHETVLTQQILELERTTAARRAPGAGSSSQSHSLNVASPAVPERQSSVDSRTKPVLSFTRPFKSGDAGSSHSLASVFSQASSQGRRRGSSAIPPNAIVGSAGTEPVPVPRGTPRGSEAVMNASSSSTTSRFSSSFVARGNSGAGFRRAGSIESRELPRPTSYTGSVDSNYSAGMSSPSFIASQADVDDFVKFIEDAQLQSANQFRSGPTPNANNTTAIKKLVGDALGEMCLKDSPASSRPSLDNSLAHFQQLREDYNQLSESMAASVFRAPNKSTPPSPADVDEDPDPTFVAESVGENPNSAVGPNTTGDSPRSPLSPLSPLSPHSTTQLESLHQQVSENVIPSSSSRDRRANMSSVRPLSVGSTGLQHVALPSTFASVGSDVGGVRSYTPVRSSPLNEAAFPDRHLAGRRRRLTFYNDHCDETLDTRISHEPVFYNDDDTGDNNDEEELLFALSDMPGKS